jgi:hypothetical protein
VVKFKHKLINTAMPDSDGVDIIYGAAINRTLQPYWDWAAEHGINISFVKHTHNDYAKYALRLIVTAEFEKADDFAIFKLAFGNKTHTNLTHGKNIEPEFI